MNALGMRIYGVAVSIALAVIGVVVSGCGHGPDPVPPPITIPTASIQAVVDQLALTTGTAIAAGLSHAKIGSVQKTQDIRPLDSKDSATFQLNAPYDALVNCTSGGSVHTSGTVTGSLTVDPDVGTDFGLVTGSGLTGVNAWTCSAGYVVNTSPEISDTITITITGATRYSFDAASGGGLSFQAVPGNNNPVVDCLFNDHVSFDSNTCVLAWSSSVSCPNVNPTPDNNSRKIC